MKVAVTSLGKTLDSKVDPRFGRARYFVVVDLETGNFEVHDNEKNASALQGAGVQAGRSVLDLGAGALITGHVGPKAFATLLAADIETYTGATGTVAEAVEAFKKGQLQKARRPDVQGHW